MPRPLVWLGQEEQLLPIGDHRDDLERLGQLTRSVGFQHDAKFTVGIDHFLVHDRAFALLLEVFLRRVVATRQLGHDDIGQILPLRFVAGLSSELGEHGQIPSIDVIVALRHIEVAIFVKNVFFVFVDVFPDLAGVPVFFVQNFLSLNLAFSQATFFIFSHLLDLSLLLLLLIGGEFALQSLVRFELVGVLGILAADILLFGDGLWFGVSLALPIFEVFSHTLNLI